MKQTTSKDARLLRQALMPYINVRQLRYLAAYQPEALHLALRADRPPAEIVALLSVLSAVLRPLPCDSISGPADVAGLLMAEMSHLKRSSCA